MVMENRATYPDWEILYLRKAEDPLQQLQMG